MKKKSKVYIQMFISYVGILLIPIAMAMMLYSYTFQIIRQQAQEMNANLLAMVRQEIDQELDNVKKIAVRLAMDNRVSNLAGKSKILQTDQYALYSIFQEVDSLTVSEEFAERIFIVFNNTRKVVSSDGNMSAALYYDLYYQNETYSLEDFLAYMESVHRGDFLTIQRETGEEVFIYAMTLISNNIGDCSATVCVEIPYDTVREHLKVLKGSDNIEVVILTGSEEKIYVDEADNGKYDLRYDESLEDYVSVTDVLDKETIVSTLPSEITDWQYVSLIPNAQIEYEAKKVQNLAIVLLFLSIISGIFISYYMSRKNYNPIKMLMENFRKQGNVDMDENENEYQWLNKQMDQFFERHIDTERLLRKSQSRLKDYYLYQLLQNYGSESPSEQYNLRLKPDHNIVLLFIPVDKYGEESAANYIEENALHKFVLMNIFEEMCSEFYNVEMVELGERVAAIVSVPDADQKHFDTLKNILEDCQQLIEGRFRFTDMILCGSVCQGWNGVHESYLQCLKLIEYISLLDSRILIYDEVKDIQPQYEYPMEIEQKIVNAMKTGDSETAKGTMLEIFDRNLQGKITTNVYRCLVYGLIGTLIEGASQGGYKTAASELQFPDGDLSGTSVEAVRRQFCELMEQICEEIRKIQKEASQDYTLSKKVQRYILENYSDPDLNISIASQYFELTPSYLSGLYKKQTGESLLDYINTVRMENAERLLEQGYSVVEAAQMTGFRDSNALIRIYKKKRGMTPGQLKKEKYENL